MSKHTPAPWVDAGIEPDYPRERNIKSGKMYIARTIGGLSEDTECANARLITAAPELLDALKNLLNACYKADLHEELSEIIDGSLMHAADIAIAKATGEAK